MTKRGRAGWWTLAVLLLALVALLLLQRRSGGKGALLPSAASAACAPSSCAQLKCASGTHPRVDADRCCRECEPNLPIVPGHDRCAREKCAACPGGTRSEPVEGQCCPTCVQLNEEACKTGKALYDSRRAALDAELKSCSADDDCIVASFGDACSASCPVALNKREIGSVVGRLREEADVYCASCETPVFECPYPDATAARCAKGRCEFLPATP